MPTTETQDKLYCGSDLHGNNVFLTLCNQKGQRVMQRRVKANLASVNQALEPYMERIESIAVESTFNWYWFVDGLKDKGMDVRLANPARMMQYTGLKSSDDKTDAGWIAEQLRLGILPEGYIYPKEVRPVRDLLRRRMFVVRQRMETILSCESLFARHAWKWPGATEFKKWKMESVQKLEADEFTELQLGSLLELMRKQDGIAHWIEGKIKEKLKPSADYKKVRMIPGVGLILGMVILLESGDFSRFPSAGDYASYCRTVQSKRVSNDKQKGTNNRKNGNRYLSWAFAEAGIFAIRYYPKIKSWYERKKRRSNIPKAQRALACKLAKATWHVMNGKEFKEEMLFH